MSNEQTEALAKARVLREALESNHKPKIGEGEYSYAKLADLPRMLRSMGKDGLFFECDPHVTIDAWNIVQMAADELEASLATPATSDTLDIKAGCVAACKSGRFECGQGTCAPICMEFLGNPRKRGCGHAERVHGNFVRAIAAALGGSHD